MDELILKVAIRFFLIFMILDKAPKGISLILQPEGSITTLQKIIDLIYDKAVKYNIVSKGNSPSKAI